MTLLLMLLGGLAIAVGLAYYIADCKSKLVLQNLCS